MSCLNLFCRLLQSSASKTLLHVQQLLEPNERTKRPGVQLRCATIVHRQCLSEGEEIGTTELRMHELFAENMGNFCSSSKIFLLDYTITICCNMLQYYSKKWGLNPYGRDARQKIRPVLSTENIAGLSLFYLWPVPFQNKSKDNMEQRKAKCILHWMGATWCHGGSYV